MTIWLMLQGEPGDAQGWTLALIREGYELDGPPISHDRASRWRSPAGGSPPGKVGISRIRPVEGPARDVAVFRPGSRQSLADAPAFFRGDRGVTAHCSGCETDQELPAAIEHGGTVGPSAPDESDD